MIGVTIYLVLREGHNRGNTKVKPDEDVIFLIYIEVPSARDQINVLGTEKMLQLDAIRIKFTIELDVIKERVWWSRICLS